MTTVPEQLSSEQRARKEALEDAYRFVTAAAKNPKVQQLLERTPVAGPTISREEFASEYADYLKD